MKRLFSSATLALSLLVAPFACNSRSVKTPELVRAPQPVATSAPAPAPVTQPLVVVPSTRPSRVADVKDTLTYLASDELEGRGIGTRGIDRAADYIAREFAKAGLRPTPGQKDFFQTFEMIAATEVGKGTALKSADRAYELRKDFIPLSISGDGKFDAPVVFAGYGISSEKYDYDDYANLDVKGKVVLVMRFEPHDEQGKSRFTADDWSTESHLTTKVKKAIEHGAAAILLVTPPDHHEDQSLMPFALMMGRERKIPAMHVTASFADELLKRGGAPDLKTLQKKIDADARPSSLALADVSIAGNVCIDRKLAKVKNVVGYLSGSGARAKEHIVIGAHYDHLGYGGMGSLAPTTRAIHNGADDNASGTSALIQLADRLAGGPPLERSILFVAFTGEEEGVVGSEHFVQHPPVPLSDIVAMLNLDMVGRLKDNTLEVGGNGTAAAFDPILKKADAASPLKLKEIGKGGLGPSDHMSFGSKKIPVLFFFSGLHADYHRPTDDSDKINYDGLRQIISFVADVTRQIASMPRQAYVAKFDSQSMHPGMPSRSRVTLGVIPDYSGAETGGVRITGTTPDSPAAKAGLLDGDVILKFGDTDIDNLYDLSDALAKGNPGQKVHLKIRRADKTIEADATLAERK